MNSVVNVHKIEGNILIKLSKLERSQVTFGVTWGNQGHSWSDQSPLLEWPESTYEVTLANQGHPWSDLSPLMKWP